MKYLRIFSFGIVLSLIACGDQSDDSLPDTPTPDSPTKDSLLVKTDSGDIEIVFPAPVDIPTVINLPFVYYTCGVAHPNDVKVFCRPDSVGFFGAYYLRNQTQDYIEIGTLISFVPNTAKNWMQGKNKESFAELTLFSGDIKVWDSIAVGMNETDLFIFIGPNVYKKKGNVISAELGEYSSSFTINKDTVSRIVIGKYCKNE